MNLYLSSPGCGRSKCHNCEACLGPGSEIIISEAFSWSLRNLWTLCSCVSVCSIGASGIIAKQVLGDEHQETKPGLKMNCARGEKSSLNDLWSYTTISPDRKESV